MKRHYYYKPMVEHWFWEYLNRNGVTKEITPRYTLEMIGVVEEKNQHLKWMFKMWIDACD